MLHTGCMSNGGVSAFGAREQQEARLPQGVVRYRELGAGQPIVLTPCDTYENFLPPMFRPLQYAARVPGSVWLIANSLRPRAPRRLPFAFGWLSKRPLPADVSDAFMHPVLSDAGVRRDVRALL